MKVSVSVTMPEHTGAIAVPLRADQVAETAHARFLASCGFTAKPGEVQLLPPRQEQGPVQVVVGLGRGGLDPVALRQVGASVARAASRCDHVALRVVDFDTAAELTEGEAAAALVEGFLLGAYRFTRYRSKAQPAGVSELTVVVSEAAEVVTAHIDRARTLADAVMLARDLVNEPGGTLTATVLAERAEAVATAAGLRCEVWDRARIEAERLGGLLGVNRGSTQPPRMVMLGYEPPDPIATIALVGKGVTFDSGGLTIKPIQMMFDMKYDMAGVAAVLGAMSTLRELRCPARALAFLPMTDNMSGGDATRLGDVLRTRDGTTVEVINADAEGRLLLADGLALAVEARPDAIVDIATLTDTAPMAVGRRFAGLAGNHPGWQDQVLTAAARAGECVWPMPLVDADRRRLDSKVADLVNTPHYRYGQSTTAALFLREFVPDDIAWAHLDIAGPAFCDDEEGVWVAGATGFGVRTLVELLCMYKRLDPPAPMSTEVERERENRTHT